MFWKRVPGRWTSIKGSCTKMFALGLRYSCIFAKDRRNALKINIIFHKIAGADLEGGVGGQIRESGGWKWGPGAKPRRGVWGRSPPEAGTFLKYTT